MKLKKKFMALALVVAMAVCMLPMSKASAASTSYSYYFDNDTKAAINDSNYFATDDSASGNACVEYSYGIKMNNAGNLDFTVTAGKYAKVTIWANTNSATSARSIKLTSTDGGGIELESEAFSVYHNKGVNSCTEYTFTGYLTGGAYSIVKGSGETMMYKVTVVEYDTVAEVPEDEVDTTTYVNVSGTITSEVNLAGGTVTLKSTEKMYTATISAGANANEYTYTAEDVAGDGAEYTVSVNATGLNEATKVVSAIAPTTITVNTEDVTNADFAVSYTNIDGVWDFATGKFDVFEFQSKGNTSSYKGLSIAISANGGKFSVREADVQVNAGTTISIPVSGAGTVTVALKNEAGFTLGGVENVATYEYDSSVNSVDLVITSNDYLLSITVEELEDTVDTTQEDMYVQYKEQQDGKYTLRFVVPVDVATVDDLDAVGVSMTVGGVTDIVTGKNLYASIYANGVEVTAPSGSAFAVIEVTNVPATAVFTEVKPAYVAESGTTTYGSSFTYSLIAED